MPLSFDPVEQARRNWSRRGEAQPVPGMTSVMRASQIMLNEVNRVLQPLGLNYARFELLMLLSFSRTGALPLGKIGERLQVHPTSITNTVDRLETDGLVVRVAHAEDRRAVLAEITDAGRKLADESADALRAADLSIRALTASEVAQLTALIRKIRLAAGDFVDGPADEAPAAPSDKPSPPKRPRARRTTEPSGR